MADTLKALEHRDRFLLCLLRHAEIALASEPTTAAGRPDVLGSPIRRPVTHFPRSLRLLGRHPRSAALVAAIGKLSGTARDVRYAELADLEYLAPIASSYPDRSATPVAGLALYLRRLRASRGIAAFDELKALPTFWRRVLLLDAEGASELVVRLGRNTASEGSLSQRIDLRARAGLPSAVNEPLSRELEEALGRCVEKLGDRFGDRFDEFSARGLSMLSVIWHQGSASGADLAVQIARSDIGVVVARLRPDTVGAGDYRQIALLARKILVRLLAEDDSAGTNQAVILRQ